MGRRRASGLWATIGAVLVAGCAGNGPLMTPGENCNDCHRPGGGARAFSVAGTVYGRPDAQAWQGVEGADVIVRDAAGNEITLGTNAAGNFYSDAAVQFPVAVEVRYGGVTRHMEPHVDEGGCAACHVTPGLRGANGRVYLAPVNAPVAR